MPPYHTMDENRTEYKDPDDVWIPTAQWTDLIAPVRGFYQLFTPCNPSHGHVSIMYHGMDDIWCSYANHCSPQTNATYNHREGVKNSIASCDMRYANACNPSIRNVCCRKMCCCTKHCIGFRYLTRWCSNMEGTLLFWRTLNTLWSNSMCNNATKCSGVSYIKGLRKKVEESIQSLNWKSLGSVSSSISLRAKVIWMQLQFCGYTF